MLLFIPKSVQSLETSLDPSNLDRMKASCWNLILGKSPSQHPKYKTEQTRMAAKRVEQDYKPIREERKRPSDKSIDEIKPYGSKIYISNDYRTIPAGPSTEVIEKIRFNNGIEVDNDDCPGPIVEFKDSNLQREILNALTRRNILCPTPVQMQAIPVLMAGRDLIAIAPTGCGKTLGYLIPLLSFLKSHVREGQTPSKISAIIMAPTRELMQQILECCKDLLHDLNMDQNLHCTSGQILGSLYQQDDGHSSHFPFVNTQSETQNHQFAFKLPHTMHSPQYSTHLYPPAQIHGVANVSGYSYAGIPNSSFVPGYQASHHTATINHYTVTGICGGVPIKEQVDMLRNGTNIIVGTPGRVIDLCQRNIICLDEIRFIVLDECDKMLDMGLEDQLRKLFAMMTAKDVAKQTSLWSATLPDSLERLARSSVINPITIHVGIKDTVSSNIEQNVIFLHTYQKKKKLLQILRQTKFPPVLIFASSIDTVEDLLILLKTEEFFVEGLHSKLPQPDRFKIISDFRKGDFDVLVATDLASRGLDIPDITHVINFDTPNSIEAYIHRCGRTGRFGRPGKTTTFLTLDCKIAEDLKFLLESTGCNVPAALQDTKQFGKKILRTEFGDRFI